MWSQWHCQGPAGGPVQAMTACMPVMWDHTHRESRFKLSVCTFDAKDTTSVGGGVGLCPAQWQAALNQREHSVRALHSECDPVRSCVLSSIRWRIHHKPCVHASVDRTGLWAYVTVYFLSETRFVYSTRWTTPRSCGVEDKFSDVKPE